MQTDSTTLYLKIKKKTFPIRPLHVIYELQNMYFVFIIN